MNLRVVLPYAVLAVIAAGAAAGVVMLRRAPATAAPVVQPALTVEVATPVTATWPRLLTANGAIAPWQEVVVASELGGLRITGITVEVGDVVQTGQLLVRLADETVAADLAAQRAALAQVTAGLAEAKANGDRARSGDGTLTQQQATQYLAAEARSAADLAVAQARLRGQELRLAQTVITASDGGVISARPGRAGAVVQAGGELLRLIRQGRLVWRAEVAPERLSALKSGVVARITLPDASLVDGTVAFIEPALDSTARTAWVQVDLPAGTSARSGMFVTGGFVLGEEPALTVPETALVLRDGRTSLFLVAEGDRVAQRFVATGRRHAGRVEIVRGVEPGARVVVSGGAFLADGDPVRIVAATP